MKLEYIPVLIQVFTYAYQHLALIALITTSASKNNAHSALMLDNGMTYLAIRGMMNNVYDPSICKIHNTMEMKTLYRVYKKNDTL